MKYIDFKSLGAWELALSPRIERAVALNLRSGAIYRVKIGKRYELTLHRDAKGARIFTLYCEGFISDREALSPVANVHKYNETLSLFTQWGEELEEDERNLDRGRVIFTGDYPSA